MNPNEYSDRLHLGSVPSTFVNAKILRQNETKAEKILWQFIRNRRLKDKKFRRQHAIAGYVLDFYCHECKLGIELDGKIHLKKENRISDHERTQVLDMHGVTVVRFT